MKKYTTARIALIVLPYFPTITAKLGEPNGHHDNNNYNNRNLQEDEPPIVKVDTNPPNRLGLCEGDCDNDGECDTGLRCFQRTEPYMAVPGCSGGAQDDSFFDYCIRNGQRFPLLSQVGVDPPISVPLERCEGDCDSDSDCVSSDLFCFTRTEARQFVPGCTGGESDDTLFDYCIRRIDVAPGVAPTVPTLDPTSNPTRDPSSNPTRDPSSNPTPDPSSNPTPTPPPVSTPTPPPVSTPTPPPQPVSTPTPDPTPAPFSNGDDLLPL
eukprot:scaffold6864_cov67-Cylindrotheca_fusiformis.AAC.1